MGETCAKDLIKYNNWVSKCHSSFLDKWAVAETKGAGQCPDGMSDGNPMRAFVTLHSNAVSTALARGGLPTCGDNAINVAGEECDGTDLGGETCASLGFSGGTLACSSCSFDTSGCSTGGGLPETGQTQCDQGAGTLGACPGSPAGQDANVGAGTPFNYTDNGDGTITDNVTGLMWEKLSDDGGIHDWANSYTWADAFNVKIGALNAGSGFAGHTDWRLPNRRELESLVDAGRMSPSIDPVFNSGCAANCTVLTCSCTNSFAYWSSTTYQSNPVGAWFVDFSDGRVAFDGKSTPYNVRAVRGGF
jgi:hypothetical protein